MIWLAFSNAAIMPIIWVSIRYLYESATDLQLDNLLKIAIVHGSVWGPTVLLGICVEWFGFGAGFAAFWLEHFSSNLYQLAYIYSLLEILQLCIAEARWFEWLGFWLYLFYS